MAGSIKWFEYTDDEGSTWAVQMDESNGEAVGNADYTDTSTATMQLPRNCNPRYARYVNAAGTIARNIIVTSAAANAGTLPATISVLDALGATVELVLKQFVGERMTRIPAALDTGLTDGDAE